MALKVREFCASNASDTEALVGLMGQLGYPTTAPEMAQRMEVIASDPLYHTFLAEYDGVVAGMIGACRNYVYERNGWHVQILALVTDEKFRGLGVGRALMDAVETWAREAGAAGIYLTSGIKPERITAHEFYKHRGYDITGYRFVKGHTVHRNLPV